MYELSKAYKDVIAISDLLIRCIIGINDDERDKKQDVLINIRMYGDFKGAAASDSIGDALDYKSITKEVIRFVESSSFNLVETLADQIASICLEYNHCRAASVRVEKPGALRFARNVGVTVNRERKVNNYIVGISGNLSPLLYLPAAVRNLMEADALRITGISPFYITAPERQRIQNPYRNGAIALETDMNRTDLNSLLKQVESDCGRERSGDRYESRTVDLDLLVENGTVVSGDVSGRWYLQVLIAGLSGMVPGETCEIPGNREIDYLLTWAIKSIVS